MSTTKLTTGERFMKIEMKMEAMHDDLTEIKTLVKEHIAWEDTKYKEMDEKYALQIEVKNLRDDINNLKRTSANWVKTAIPYVISLIFGIIAYLK